MPERDRVHFLLRMMLDIHDPAVAGAMSFAAHQITDRAQQLIREACEQECG